jgi:hypothetical protein
MLIGKEKVKHRRQGDSASAMRACRDDALVSRGSKTAE